MRASFPEERKWRVLVEQISPVTGPQQTSIRWVAALWYVPKIRTLTSSPTNKYSLRTCKEPRIIEISLAKQVKPSPYHEGEWGSSSFQNLLTKIGSFVLPFTFSFFPSQYLPTVGEQWSNSRWLFPQACLHFYLWDLYSYSSLALSLRRG